MWLKLSIGVLCTLIILDSVLAEEKDDKKAISKRVKRSPYGRRRSKGRVQYKIIDEHHDDHGHDDYQDFNFFGHDDDHDYGHDYHDDHHDYHDDHDDYHDDHDYDHHDYHDDHDYGHADHDYGHDDHDYGYGHSASDYHDFGGSFHDYDNQMHGSYGHDNGGYGKSSGKGYKRVKSRKGYKKFYKPKVVIVKKIVPLSTTTMP